MAITEKMSAVRRPNLSPIWPTNTPPIGRIRWPIANTPNTESSWATGS